MENKYYVYVYLDPRKPGKYKYGEYEFDYEPFYVGKGNGNRYKAHLNRNANGNNHLFYKIQKIIKKNLHPIIIIVKDNLFEVESFNLEKKIISLIGRNTLLNLSDGGEGTSGFKHSIKSKEKMSKFSKNKTYEERYGKEKAIELKVSRIFSNKKKNKTFEEVYGVEKAKEIKNKISKNTSKMNVKSGLLGLFKGENNPNAKEYLIISPSGEKFFTRCLLNFCKEHKLTYDYLIAMATGRKKSSYKGWTCQYYSSYGLNHLNIELSSLCDKNCVFCGRRERERKYGKQNYGFIDFELLKKISKQLPKNTVVAFHNNGESLLYPRFKEAVRLFKHCITYLVTNGKKLVEKAPEIINNLDVISISIIEGDTKEERELQYNNIEKFLILKKDLKPRVVLRFVGKVDEEPYKNFNLLHVNRILHDPKGSINYQKPPVIPEHGICLEILSKLSIDRFGNVSVCVRFDPEGELVLGNIKEKSIFELWNSKKRLFMLKKHVEGKRNEVPYCGNKCDYWGIPRGY